MKRQIGKKSARELRRQAERSTSRAQRELGASPSIRWRGNNLDELVRFVERHGGSLGAIAQRDESGQLRDTLVVQPVMMSIRPGRRLTRVLKYDAADPRGWATHL